MIVISHDRYFLDRVCSHTLAFEGDGEVNFFEGTYSEYERDRKRTKGTCDLCGCVSFSLVGE